jgi:HSP20 family protein
MLFPSIFNENLMSDWFDDGFDKAFLSGRDPLYGKNAARVMKTDVRDCDDHYEIDVDLPGFKKDEITVQLKNGYLNIAAVKDLDKDEMDKKTGKMIRQERYSGSAARSFYVGSAVKQEDVHAKYENGVLTLSIPKKEAEKNIDTSTVNIEG